VASGWDNPRRSARQYFTRRLVSFVKLPLSDHPEILLGPILQQPPLPGRWSECRGNEGKVSAFIWIPFSPTQEKAKARKTCARPEQNNQWQTRCQPANQFLVLGLEIRPARKRPPRNAGALSRFGPNRFQPIANSMTAAASSTTSRSGCSGSPLSHHASRTTWFASTPQALAQHWQPRTGHGRSTLPPQKTPGDEKALYVR